jgi:hypothetical protein
VRLSAGPVAALAALLLSACGLEEWRNADVQLEIQGASLDTQASVRVCVAEAGTRNKALKAGRVAFPGLPDEGALTVTVDAFESEDTGFDAVRIGRAGPVLFEENGLQTTDWQDCQEDCEPCRQEASPADPDQSRLLAVRFLGLER